MFSPKFKVYFNIVRGVRVTFTFCQGTKLSYINSSYRKLAHPAQVDNGTAASAKLADPENLEN